MAIEFSRDITFGQYLNLDSPIHRLDPRTKILACTALMLSVFVIRSFAGLALLLLGIVFIHALSRIQTSYTLRGMRLLFGTLLIVFIFQMLFYTLPADATPIWRWGLLSLSWEGMRHGVLIIWRVLMLYYLTSTLMFTTPMMDLADGIEVMFSPLKRLRLPVNELVMVLVIAIKFVPLLVAELERLIKAQTARGARFDQGNFIQRVRKLGPVLIPLFINAFNRAETLTMAMNARCYRGGQGRTKRRVLTLHRADLLALAVAVAIAAGGVVVGQLVYI
ncbi:MAG: energy-coupling factor transporter transmembrane protein EcfT [Chloroflexales bacterium]|nr:energy-coupling factor transporter transmembrane protein EcfT [Chloroflexales bacterium]